MELLQALKFVAGAVAKSDYLPALQHVAIGGGFVVSFNGTVALCAPVTLDLAACPRADIFAKAIAACTEPAQLHLTEQGLTVQSGALRVTVPCTHDTFPRVFPEGFAFPLGGPLLPAFKALLPFVSTDTTKQWSNGILLRGSAAYATNNAILVEYWLGGTHFQVELNIPLAAVRALVHTNEEPARLQLTEKSATFHFADGRWMRTQLHPTTWPQSLTSLLSHTAATPLPEGFFAALAQLAGFAEDGDAHLSAEGIGTSTDSKLGAHVALAGLTPGPRFSVQQLSKLAELATAIDFADYPQPCRFIGGNARGVILGKV